MPASGEVAQRRLSVLRLAERLGNASEACRRSGVDRTSFYQWKRRFAREGLAGLADRKPVRTSHPLRTPARVERRILELSLASPAHGCDRVARTLAKEGADVSAVTIQKILHKANLGTHEKRAGALEARYAEGRKLTPVQVEFLEHVNPCFRERDLRASGPGEILCVGAFFVGRFEGPGAVYMHTMVDWYSCYGFGVLATTTGIQPTLEALHSRVLPFLVRHQVTVRSVLSGKLSETSAGQLDGYLRSRGIEYRASDDTSVGFVESLRRNAINDFLRRPVVRRLSRTGLPRLQRELDDWLGAYNETQPHEGYPNYGSTPRSVLTSACERPA